jgi:hypothetical protein
MKIGPLTFTRHPFLFQRKRGFFNAGTRRHWNFGFAHPRTGVLGVQWLGRFVPWNRTHDTSLTIDVADKSVELFITYTFNAGSHDWFGGGCWNPGDPDEIEIARVEVVTRDGNQETYVEAQPWLYDIISSSDLVFEHIGTRHERDEPADYELDRP